MQNFTLKIPILKFCRLVLNNNLSENTIFFIKIFKKEILKQNLYYFVIFLLEHIKFPALLYDENRKFNFIQKSF